MISEKIENLLERLLERSRAGSVKWERTAEEGSFRAAFPKYSVSIESYEAEGSKATYQFELFNESGDLIESATDYFLDKPYYDHRNRDLLEELFVLARRKALGVDEAIDDILQELGELPPPDPIA